MIINVNNQYNLNILSAEVAHENFLSSPRSIGNCKFSTGRRGMLVPRRAKYRKQQRGSMKGIAQRGTRVSFGEYGLISEGTGWITARQIEAARRSITHYTQRGGRIWIRIFPDKPISKKPAEVRMGGGKGDVSEFVAPVRRGRMLFEMGGVTREVAMEALRLASHKLGIKTRVVEKGHL